MKVLRLRCDNFKRLVVVDLSPNGDSVKITGKNKAGKSSILDAIEVAFCGAKSAPDKPIRKGQSGAKIVVETEDLVVTRKWTAKSDSLLVANKEGMVYRAGQSVLDKLNGTLSFDPGAFSRMEPKEQAALLRKITGLDTSKLEGERLRVYNERTMVNADAKKLSARVEAAVLPECPDEIPEEIDVASLVELKDATVAELNANKACRDKLQGSENAIKAYDNEISRLQSLISDVKIRLECETKHYNEIAEKVDALKDPDVAPINAKLAKSKDHNEGVRRLQKFRDDFDRAEAEKARLEQEAKQAKDKADSLTARIEAIDATKQKMLADAKFPVPGMSVEGDTVLIDGVPFSQASTSEQIRIGLAMGAALNPELRVVLIRDGSLLDDESKAYVAKYATEHDIQVFMEIVDDQDGDGVEIVDGTVAVESGDE